jgi:WD40 repeat protein
MATEVQALAHMYGGNPLALMLVAEPIRELFGGDVGTFLTAGSSFFNGVGKLLEQQFARSTPLEQTLLYALAIERELVPINVLLAKMTSTVLQRDALVALESLRRRLLIEQAVNQPALTLQPVILEFLTDQLVESVYLEIVTAQPRLLLSHACIHATAKDYVRRSQERLIARPLLERLLSTDGNANAVERQLLAQLDSWRDQPPSAQGYGPGNLVNLLRLLRGDLRGLNLAHLAIRQAFLQGVDMQDSILAGTQLQNTVFSEAFDAILAVAVSGTGEYWAASSRRGEIRVWAADGQTLHRVWRAHTDMVWALTLSPDGNTLASGSWDGTVKLWHVASGTLRWVGRHTSGINRVVFAPDGQLLASSGNDATVRFWDWQSGALLHTLPHPGPVIAISWSRAGRLFASGDIAGIIRLWELPTTGPPICVQTIQAHTVWLNGLVFAPDGRTLVSVSWDRTVKLWDVASGHIRATLSGHTDRVLRVDWSRDGRVLASSGRDQTLRLWDVELGEYRAVLRGHSGGIDGLAFAPDSRTLISGSEDGTVRVWDVADGQCVRVMQGYAPVPYVVDWSPDSVQLISGGTDRLVTIWDTAEQAPRATLSGHSGVVCGVGWSSDGQCLASSEWDNAIRLWEPASGACLRMLRHPNDSGNCFYDLSWSPDGRRLASGTNRHGVQVFERTAQQHHWEGRQFPTVIRHIAWSPTGMHLAGAGDDGIVYVWSPDEDTPVQRLAGHTGAVRSLAWSPDGTRLASGGGGGRGELFVWDLGRGEREGSLIDEAGMVSAVAWGASDALVVSGGGDGTVRCWDVRGGQVVWASQAHQGTVQSLRRSPDGTKLASCGDDGAIIIWDMRTGAQRKTLRRDRPYERMDITGLTGVTAAQRASLITLGAVDGVANR